MRRLPALAWVSKPLACTKGEILVPHFLRYADKPVPQPLYLYDILECTKVRRKYRWLYRVYTALPFSFNLGESIRI
jgi:hypothetical protein